MTTTMTRATAYRSLLRELKNSSLTQGKISKPLAAHFRSIVEASNSSEETFSSDVNNAVLSLRSQREYKTLLDRYNPLVNYTAEERIQATARRVGLDMPLTPENQKPEE